jgi:rubrerythrin
METRADGSRLLAGIPWERGKPDSVSTDVVRLLVAASLVESRGDSYGAYLSRVFFDEPEFIQAIRKWSREEDEHGVALSTWLVRSLPNFQFQVLLERYNSDLGLSYQNSTNETSIRGSKAGELLSRCAVESSTSTYYKSVADAVDDEPLKTICLRLAHDEIGHYSLFRKKLDRLREAQRISPLRLLYMSLHRLLELEDDQMSYAFYLACGARGSYDRAYFSKALVTAAFGLYSDKRIAELVKLNVRAFGVSKSKLAAIIGHDRMIRTISSCLRFYMRSRVAYLTIQQIITVFYELIVTGRFESRCC